ncbi:MAG: plasmid pRiA4b ORF-3 family protein [Verrucomicrobia bacterium]|nr:plasmid pRiA4b ORF-3 family protein [Verrucomicrobiota bacterium]
MIATTEEQKGFRIKIELRWSNPSIWRTVSIPKGLSLAELHELIQIVMGWEDYHLHQFKYKNRIIGVPHPEDWQEVEDERDVFVDEIFLRKGSRIEYEYDFGDGWIHDIISLGPIKLEDKVFKVLDGAMACPPEDCGGIYGYYRMLEILSDPEHEEHDEIQGWMGDDFDPNRFEKAP